MCGIAGSTNKEFILTGDELKHRGSDNFSIFKDDKIIFYHWRLAIIDLSKNGNQPIFNEDKTVAVIFNGEIYNYQELKNQYLTKHKFYTNTDTEVAVHLYEEFGEDFIKYLNGDFSIALWDKKKETIFLWRDRLGIRPLYYSFLNGQLYFASEIKPLLKIGNFKKDLDFEAVNSYLSLRYILNNESTFFKHIKKVPAGYLLKYNNRQIKLTRYWNINFIDAKKGVVGDTVEEFYNLFSDSVRLRMIADVPIGAFLSGGIDSSGIVYEMSRFHKGPVKTFSIGFDRARDETRDAKNFSKFCNTDHQSFYINETDYENYEKIIYYLDELPGDSIVLPTFLLAQKAKETVRVVLTGEGADEIMGGYIHQFSMFYLFKYWADLPAKLQAVALGIVNCLPNFLISAVFPYPERIGGAEKNRITDFLKNFSEGKNDILQLVSVFNQTERKDLLRPGSYHEAGLNYQAESFTKMIDNDLQHWLPNYTLLKQDRLMMANSIEGRSPFLDHRLVEFCAQIPNSLRVDNFQTKIILRKAFQGRLPAPIIGRKKKAFYLPINECFDSHFWDYLREVLSKDELDKTGLFNWLFVDKLLKKERNLSNTKKIFNVFLLQLWLKRFGI